MKVRKKMSKLAKGYVVDVKKVLGVLNFQAVQTERKVLVDGEATGEIRDRTYGLFSHIQGSNITVKISGKVPLKNFEFDTEVELVNPKVQCMATPTFNGAEVNWWIEADDIVKKGAGSVAKPFVSSQASPQTKG
jgi:hypothetical protein